MKHIAAYLLLQLGGNASPSTKDITNLLATVGIDPDTERLEKLISELEGKSISDLIAEGSSKLSSVSAQLSSLCHTEMTWHEILHRYRLGELLLLPLVPPPVVVVPLPLLPRKLSLRRRSKKRFVFDHSITLVMSVSKLCAPLPRKSLMMIWASVSSTNFTTFTSRCQLLPCPSCCTSSIAMYFTLPSLFRPQTTYNRNHASPKKIL